MEQVERYQDLVIKDGQFVGRFEEMYQQFADPWHQSEPDHNILSVSRNIAMLNISRYKIRSLAEFGCGLGYYTDLIRRSLGIQIVGVDVSPTAITKARKKFPAAEFVVDDISNIGRYIDYEAILFAEITWYILDRLERVFDDMLGHFSGKYFLHNLVFYKEGRQQYGRKYFTNLDEFIAFCPFRLLSRAEYTTSDPTSTIETSAVFQIEPK